MTSRTSASSLGPGPQFLHRQQVGLALGSLGGVSPLGHPGVPAGGRLTGVGWEGAGFEQSEETEWGDVGVTAWLPVICVQLNEQVLGTRCPPEAGAGGQ